MSLFDADEFTNALFFPRKGVGPCPSGAEDTFVLVNSTPSVSLAVRLHRASSPKALILWFHGNGEIVSDYDPMAQSLVQKGVSVAIVDYRGYGQSEGCPSLRSCLNDCGVVAKAALEWAKSPNGPVPIIVYGRSLGGYLATELMKSAPSIAAGYVLESAAIDLRGLVRRRGLNPDLVTETDQQIFDPIRKLSVSRVPLLVMHGDCDTMVPPNNAQMAFDASSAVEKKLVWLKGFDHNNTFYCQQLWIELARFIDSVVAKSDKKAGSIVVQGLGDALGFLVEGHAPDYCEGFANEWFSRGEPPFNKRGPFSFGQYSDDTQLARELAISLVINNGWVPEDYAQRLAILFKENTIVGRGRATENAANRILQGVHWTASGEPSPNAGNGGAMRAGPVGLLSLTTETRMKIAAEQAKITHADPRAIAAAQLVAQVVALALEQKDLRDDHLRQELSALISPLDSALAQSLEQFPRWLSIPLSDASAEIAQVGANSPRTGETWWGISPYATPSALFAAFAYSRSPTDVCEVLRVSVGVGGDVDTVAAMAGAMVGARVGYSALPTAQKSWVSLLNDCERWTAPELMSLAFRLPLFVIRGGLRTWRALPL